MGGRVALYYTIYGQYEIKQLILESTSPGIADETLRKERQAIDQARGRVLEIAGIEVFVNDWEKLPLFQTQYLLDDNKNRQCVVCDIKSFKRLCLILSRRIKVEKFVNTAKKWHKKLKTIKSIFLKM